VEQALAPGAFLLFLGLSMKLYQPAKWLSKFPSMVQPGLSAADRIFEFLDTPVDMVDDAGPARLRWFPARLDPLRKRVVPVRTR
jgi:ATP-binding cassette, subfamily B, bacterial MsbA